LKSEFFKATGQAITDFNMIEEGDKIMVAVSGGKDSWVMLSVLNALRGRAPVNFDIIAVNLDQGYEGSKSMSSKTILSKKKFPITWLRRTLTKSFRRKIPGALGALYVADLDEELSTVWQKN